MKRTRAESFTRLILLNREWPYLWVLKNRSWHTLWQVREHLIIRARDAAQKRGRSYREFHVGAAALLSSTKPHLLRSLGRSDHVIYTGSNWKAGRHERNTCAEQEIVAQIRQQQHIFPVRKVLALVIAGEPQNEPDPESGIITRTLHPCPHCRKLLQETKGMHKGTIIMCIRLNEARGEVMTFGELLRRHARPS